jgi:hypothetical protein
MATTEQLLKRVTNKDKQQSVILYFLITADIPRDSFLQAFHTTVKRREV